MAEHQPHPICADPLGPGFQAERHATRGTITVRLHGELDLDSAPDLACELLKALDAVPIAVVLDLADLTFLESSGIHTIVVAAERARAAGCGFSLRSPRRQVLKVLHITGVDRFITVDASCPPAEKSPTMRRVRQGRWASSRPSREDSLALHPAAATMRLLFRAPTAPSAAIPASREKGAATMDLSNQHRTW